MIRPLISIIVISRDDPEGLRRTIDSIRRQTHQDYEVVMVCKGTSTEAVIPFGLSRLVRIEQKGSGISNAFNEGLQSAKGQWINFLNGGDAYGAEDVLSTVASQSLGSIDVVTARAYDRHSRVRLPRDTFFRAENLELVSHQATFFSAELFARFGHYDASYRIRMDFEWMLRLPRDTRVCWIDRDLVDFEGNGISSLRPWQSCNEEFRALRRHGRSVVRIASLLLVYAPWRVARTRWRALRA